MGRRTRSGVIHSQAECQGCSWTASTYRNALALAAIHHDKTGHEVRVEHCVVVIYGGNDEQEDSSDRNQATAPAG